MSVEIKAICSIKLCGMKATFASSDTFVYLCVRHKLLFAKELNPKLVEQIAEEIMSKCRNETKTYDYEGGPVTVSGCLEYFDNEIWGGYYEAVCTHLEDANQARSLEA